jgi:2-iminobutanoate/2-iminopropanoate deaminase
MGKERIVPPQWKAHNKYSAGFKVSDGGLVILSGKGAVDADGNIIAIGDMVEQTRWVMDMLGHMLEMGGASMNDVIKSVIYTTNVKYFFEEAWPVYASYFEDDYPAATLLGVTELAFPELLVEIDLTAFVPNEK